MSKFIVFEGIDGSGKTSAMQFASGLLEGRGIDHICTREPGGTPTAELIRELVMSSSMGPITTAMLMFAARHEHLQDVILPHLAEGRVVLCDRYYLSTRVYQHQIGAVAWEQLVNLSGSRAPDATILLTCPVRDALRRASVQTAFEGALTFEDYQAMSDNYLIHVNQGAKKVHGDVFIIETQVGLAEVQCEVQEAIEEILSLSLS